MQSSLPPVAELPDPFAFTAGGRADTPEAWARRRREIAELVFEIEYGGLPPTPAETRLEELHTSLLRHNEGVRFMSCRVQTGPDRPFSFLLTLLIPPGDGPFPVVLTGDACWRYVTDAIADDVVGRGFILAQFNRTEIVPDIYRTERTSGLYRVYPEGTYGALSAWAWGYHRCIDALSTLPFVDASRLAITGHSRGGKTVLLAGAADERIVLTAANNSGAGGAGCFRCQGPKAETLADLMGSISYWFGPKLRAYLGREAELPFDQHFLKALIAPRALLTTEALGDLWANPSGTWQTHLAAREVYRLLGAEERIAIGFRDGGHSHGANDWRLFLDVMAWQLCGKPKPQGLDACPFS